MDRPMVSFDPFGVAFQEVSRKPFRRFHLRLLTLIPCRGLADSPKPNQSTMLP